MSYLLHPFHLSILHQGYAKEYKNIVMLILSAKEYLNVHDYQLIFCSDIAATALRRFIMSVVYKKDYYMLLVYALRVYMDGRGHLAVSADSMGRELREV